MYVHIIEHKNYKIDLNFIVNYRHLVPKRVKLKLTWFEKLKCIKNIF